MSGSTLRHSFGAGTIASDVLPAGNNPSISYPGVSKDFFMELIPQYNSDGTRVGAVPFDELNLVPSSVYKCPVCQQDFYDKAKFRQHYMVHSGEKPYSCPYCEYRARQKNALKKHVVNKHFDKPLLP